mgnify:CR=1 FL=1
MGTSTDGQLSYGVAFEEGFLEVRRVLTHSGQQFVVSHAHGGKGGETLPEKDAAPGGSVMNAPTPLLNGLDWFSQDAVKVAAQGSAPALEVVTDGRDVAEVTEYERHRHFTV